jgi:hypothetical protein
VQWYPTGALVHWRLVISHNCHENEDSFSMWESVTGRSGEDAGVVWAEGLSSL